MCLSFPLQIGRDSSPWPLCVQECRAESPVARSQSPSEIQGPAFLKTRAGAGIGLFVSRQLVSAMGGRMTARNLPEGGAEFLFELPIFGLT